ncbi:MAG: DNA-processing protein DprA [Chitinispirillaceae bacterium]
MYESWIALNSISGLGPVRIGQLLEHFGSPEEVFRTSPDLLRKQGLIPESCLQRLKDDSLFPNACKQLEKCRKSGVQILTLDHDQYPMYLKEIFAPPPVLYVKGDLSVFKKHAFAVVGTRSPTSYGKQVARKLAGDISTELVIVSGLAKGIDTAAHESCLEKRGKTVAVLGCGIDRIYPRDNEELAERICSNGTLVSEFPLGAAPEAFNFPRRNRIISGLSSGVLVVEAGAKSGALITAHYALQQGREVFAVPGPINSPMSIGTFNLLKQGAVPVSSAQDIMENISGISAKPLLEPLNETDSFTPETDPAAVLSSEEQQILNTLSEEPIRIDELSERSGVAVSELFTLLLNLELKGFVDQICGQQFRRVL